MGIPVGIRPRLGLAGSDRNGCDEAVKAIILAAGIVGIGCVSAAEIRWTARGTVSSVSGSGFSGIGVSVSNTAEFEMVYDSDILIQPRSFLPIGAAIYGTAWFHGTANLRITVKVGGQTWTGEMPEIPSDVDVMELSCWDSGGNPDVFKLNLDAARGGNFPSFPQSGVVTTRALKLEFRDTTSPAELFNVHVLPDSLTKVCEMTSATGSIVAGTSSIAFILDPKSVGATLPQVPVSISREGPGIQLAWKTDPGKTYRIEGSSDLRCWSSEGVFPGTGGIFQQALTPFGIYPKRFYRIAEY